MARGLAKEWKVPVWSFLVRKEKHTRSQTTNDRFGRWDNVQQTFKSLRNLPKELHILIVDDVITTGATLESLVCAIRDSEPSVQISLLSFAFTK